MRIDLLQVRFLQTENNLARYDPLVLWVPAEEAESTSGGLAVVELEVGVEGKGGSVLEEVGLDGDAVGTGRLPGRVRGGLEGTSLIRSARRQREPAEP
jgi:hypothetical protein